MRQRRELIEPSITEHHGKLINYAGDGFLAMFDSPVEAVRCAIVIHQGMVGRNTSLPREQWIYRIGVHLGDVIVEPDGVFGDGVNIAARLEGIATPGDLFISGGVYEQIKNKLVCAYQSLGDRQVKNITDPVSVYRVLPDPAALSQARRQALARGAARRFDYRSDRYPGRMVSLTPTKADRQSSADTCRDAADTRNARR